MRYPLPLVATLAATFGIGAAQAAPPAVVTDIPVTHALVAQVMDGLATPELLLDRGGDAHHFQLRPSQARALSRADLVVWVGPDLTPWLESTAETLGEGQALSLIMAEGTATQAYRPSRLLGDTAAEEQDDDHDHDHAHGGHGHDDHDHDHDEHHHDDAHEPGAIDPHAWLNPDNAAHWLSVIAEHLAALDPDNAATYRENAEQAQARVAALADDLAEVLEPARDAGLVVYHDAYGYLAQRFDLNLLGAITLGDAAEPGAARLSAIRANLEQAGAECLFPEVNHTDAHVELVTEGTSIRLGAALDPSGTAIEPGPALYETLMRNLARSIADCASG